MNAAEINAIGVMLQSIRHPDERFVTLNFTAHAPGFDTFEGSISVTVASTVDTATSEGCTLDSALHLARAKLRNHADAKAKAAAEAKDKAQ
jgi:hypothetical protein